MVTQFPESSEPGYGERIAIARRKMKNIKGRKLSQGDFARLLGVHPMYVWKLENEANVKPEERRPVTGRTFRALHAIGINPWWVSNGQEPIFLESDGRQEPVFQALIANFKQVSSIWRVKEGHGCEPVLQAGDIAILNTHELQEKALWVCAPQGVNTVVIDGQASGFCIVGYLRNLGTVEIPRWSLYQPAAPDQTILLKGWTMVGEVTQIIRTIT